MHSPRQSLFGEIRIHLYFGVFKRWPVPDWGDCFVSRKENLTSNDAIHGLGLVLFQRLARPNQVERSLILFRRKTAGVETELNDFWARNNAVMRTVAANKFVSDSFTVC